MPLTIDHIISAGSTIATLNNVNLVDANGASFGIAGSNITLSYSVPTDYVSSNQSSLFQPTSQMSNYLGTSYTTHTHSQYINTSVASQFQFLSNSSLSLGTQAANSFRHTSADTQLRFTSQDSQLQFTSQMSDYQTTGNYLTTQSGQAYSAGNGSNTFQTLSIADSNGVSFSTGSQGLYATVRTNYQSSGNYLTTAMQSDAGSRFVNTSAGLNLTNISVTLNSNSISLSVANPAAQPIAASASNGSFLFSTLGFVETNGVTWATSTDGIRASVQTNYQSTGNYLTTAAQSNQVVNSLNGSTGQISLNVGSSLSSSTNGSSITFGLASNITTALQSAGNYLTTAMASNRGTDFIQATAAFAGTNNSGTIASGGISVSGLNQAVSFTSGSTTFQTLSFTNSNGFSFNSGTQGIFGSYTVPAITNSSWTVSDSATSGSVARLAFTNLNGITLSLSTGAGGSHTIVGSHNALTSQSNQAWSGSNASSTFQTLSFNNNNGISWSNNAGAVEITHGLQFTSNTSNITSNALNTSVSRIINLIAATNNTGGGTASLSSNVSFTNANGATFYTSAGNAIALSYTVPVQTTQSGFTSAGNNIGLSGTLNQNGLSLSATVAAQTVQTQNLHNVTLSGNTAGVMAQISSGTMTIAGGNNITISQNGNAITISGANVGGAQTGISGIILSNTTYTSGTVSFIDGNGVSWASGAAQGISITHSLQQLSNTSNITSNALNTSVSRVINLIAATNNTGGGTASLSSNISFSNANNFTFYTSAGNAIVGSFSQSADTNKAGTGFTSAGANISLSGTLNTNGLSLSASVLSQSVVPQNISLFGLGNTTQNSSTVLSANALSINAIGSLTIGYSNGSIQFSAPNALTTAMQSNASTQFVQANAVFNGTNASGTIASNAISISVLSQSNQTLSKAITGNTTGNTSGMTVDARSLTYQGLGALSVGLSTSAGGSSLIFSSPVQTIQTQNMVSVNGSTGNISLNVGSSLSSSQNGSSITFGLASNITTALQSAGAYLTTAAQSSQTNAFSLGGNSGTTNSSVLSAGGYIIAGGSGVTLSQSNNSLSWHVATTWAPSNHSHGNPTLALTNLTGTTASASNGLTLSLSGNAAQTIQSAIRGFGVSNTGATAGNTGISTGIDWVLAGSNLLTLSQSTAGGGPNTVWIQHPAWLTTARASNDAIGLNTAQTNVTWTVNSSGLSLNAAGYAGTGTTFNGANLSASMTLNSAGLNLSMSAAAPGGGGGIAASLSGNSTSAGAGYSNITSGTMILAGGPNITLSQDGSRISISANAPGAAVENNNINLLGANTSGNTTASGSTIGWSGINLTLSGTNGSIVNISAPAVSSISGTGHVSVSANGSTISIGAPSPSISGSNGSFSYSTLTMGNLNGLSFYTSNGSLVGSVTPLVTLYSFEPYPINNTGTAASSAGTATSGSVSFFPFILEEHLAAGWLNIVQSMSFITMGTSSGQQSATFNYGLYSRGTAANSTTLASITSGSYSWGVTYNNSTITISQATITNSTGYGYGSTTSAGLNISSGYTGMKLIQLPLNTTLAPGNYWLGLIGRESTSSNSGGLRGSVYGNALSLTGLAPIGSFSSAFVSGTNFAGTQGAAWNFGQGIFTSAGQTALPASVALSAITGSSVAYIPYMKFFSTL